MDIIEGKIGGKRSEANPDKDDGQNQGMGKSYKELQISAKIDIQIIIIIHFTYSNCRLELRSMVLTKFPT